MKLMEWVADHFFCIIGLAVAAYSLIAVFVPSIRANWRGSRIRLRVMSHIGLAMVFGSGGLMSLGEKAFPKAIEGILGVIFIVGFGVGILGKFRDDRESKDSDGRR